MTKAELIKALEKYPDDMVICGSCEWEFEIDRVEVRTFDDESWIEETKDVFGKECIFLT